MRIDVRRGEPLTPPPAPVADDARRGHALRATRSVPALAVSVLSSGQHRDLLAPLVNWFELSIDADLQLMTQDPSLAELTARLMQGDTTTVLCAALSCFYLDIPFGHVEAGLRTFQPRNPFPEEFNRVAVGRLARLHFCPTLRARDNLLAERVGDSAAQLTGNTVIDALRFTTAKLEKHPVPTFDHDILLTAHRRENFGAPLTEIFRALLELCR